MKENDIWRQQSMVIDWLRFPLIVLVVYIHNRGKGVLPIEEIDWSFHRGIDFYSWLSYSICRVIASIAVPSFFIISGYFFFWKVKEWCFAVYKEKLRARFKTLLVPYILWNVISLIAPVVWHLAIAWHSSQHITYLSDYLESIDWIRWIWDCSYEAGVVNRFGFIQQMTYPINVPMWYIRDLMVMVLLSPVVYWLVKHLHYYYLLILLTLSLIGLWPNIHGLSCSAAFYFSIGAYCGINKFNMLHLARRVEIPNYVLTLLLLVLLCSPFHGLKFWGIIGLNTFFILSCIVSVFCISSRLIGTDKIHQSKNLPQFVFFVYVVHEVYIIRLYNMLFLNNYFDIDNIPLAIVFFLTTPWIKILLCLSFFWLMKRYTPRALNVLTGSR